MIAGDQRSLQSKPPGCYYALLACTNPEFILTFTEKKKPAKNTVSLRGFVASITRQLMTLVLTFYYVRLTQTNGVLTFAKKTETRPHSLSFGHY